MGPGTHFCLLWGPQPSYNVRDLSLSCSIIFIILSFTLVGGRVQVPSPLVSTSSLMMEIRRDFSMEGLWYGCEVLLTKQENKFFFFFSKESGSPMNLQDITDQQPLFDQLVADTGCTGSADLIACLRTVPLDTLMTAVNKSPTFLSFNSQSSWRVSVDGHLIVRNPLVSVQKGLFAKVLFLLIPQI